MSFGGRIIVVFGIFFLVVVLWGVLMVVIFNLGYGVKMIGF